MRKRYLVLALAVLLLAAMMACGPSVMIEPMGRAPANIGATVVVVSTAAALGGGGW